MNNTKNELIKILGEPNYDLQVINREFIINSDMLDYNYSEGISSLDRIGKYNPTFYLSPKNEIYSYDRLFIKYKVDGLELFREFNLFHSCIHNGGFRKANVIELEGFAIVYIFGFGEKLDKAASNNNENRKMFIKHNITVTDL